MEEQIVQYITYEYDSTKCNWFELDHISQWKKRSFEKNLSTMVYLRFDYSHFFHNMHQSLDVYRF